MLSPAVFAVLKSNLRNEGNRYIEKAKIATIAIVIVHPNAGFSFHQIDINAYARSATNMKPVQNPGLALRRCLRIASPPVLLTHRTRVKENCQYAKRWVEPGRRDHPGLMMLLSFGVNLTNRRYFGVKKFGKVQELWESTNKSGF